MNTLEDIAFRIPDNVRSQRLLVADDPIQNAITASSDPHMQLLMAIWFEFVEPNGDMNLNCPFCLNNVLTNFRAILPYLLALEKDYQIILKL